MIAIVRVGLAAVFLIAGVAKLLDRPGGRDAMRGFGASERLAGPLAVVLAVAEIGVAVALVPAGTARVAATVAVGLLVLMLAATWGAIRRGQAPDCHCFGALHSAPVGRWTVVRLVALAAVGAAIAMAPAPAATWTELAVVGAAAVLIVQGAVMVQLLRRYGRALRRIDELERGRERTAALTPGAVAPSFELPDLAGIPVSLSGLLAAGRPLLLAFVDPMCGPCRELLPKLSAWQGELAGRATVAVVSGGERAEIRAVLAPLGLRYVLVRGDHSLPELYGAEATPSALVIAPDGTVTRGVASGAVAIEELARELGRAEPALVPPEPAVEHSSPAGIPTARTATAAAAAAGALAVISHGSPDALADEADEVAAVRTALDAALTSQLALMKRSGHGLRSVSRYRRGAKGRRTRRRVLKTLKDQRRDLAQRSTALEQLQLSSARAASAQRHAIAFFVALHQDESDLSRFVVARPGEAKRIEKRSSTRMREAFSHLFTADTLLRG